MVAALAVAVPSAARGQGLRPRPLRAGRNSACARRKRRARSSRMRSPPPSRGQGTCGVRGLRVPRAAQTTVGAPTCRRPRVASRRCGARTWTAPVSAAREVATVWGPQSDRDRRRRAQREKEEAAREAAREKDREQRDRDRENPNYDQGQSALDSGRWDRAVSSFDRVVELKGTRPMRPSTGRPIRRTSSVSVPRRWRQSASFQGISQQPLPGDAKALEVEVKHNRPAGETGVPSPTKN